MGNAQVSQKSGLKYKLKPLKIQIVLYNYLTSNEDKKNVKTMSQNSSIRYFLILQSPVTSITGTATKCVQNQWIRPTTRCAPVTRDIKSMRMIPKCAQVS